MWETRDPDGRRVILTLHRWRHIVDRHAELAELREAILRAVRQPVHRLPGLDAHEQWFYGQGFGPSRFVRVVVHFHEGIGRITTAFPRRRFP